MKKFNADESFEDVAYDPALLAFQHGRYQVLVPFLGVESMGDADPVRDYGFYEINTGGGCRALRRDLEGGHYLLLTDDSGVDIPGQEWESSLIGRYNDQDEQIAICTASEAFESLNSL